MLLAVLDVAAYVQAGAVAGIPDDYPRDETQIGLAWQVGFRVAPDVSLFGGYRSISLPSLSSLAGSTSTRSPRSVFARG